MTTPRNLRDNFVLQVQQMLDGKAPTCMTQDTLTKPLLCAQHYRQITECALKLNPGTWPMYPEAGRVAAQRGTGRYAATYEQAAKNLGLTTIAPRFGDALYYGWYDTEAKIEYGHVVMYVVIDGVEYGLENTVANRGQLVFGSGPVRLTRLADIERSDGKPRTIALPDKRLAGMEPTLKASRVRPVTPPSATSTVTISVPTVPKTSVVTPTTSTTAPSTTPAPSTTAPSTVTRTVTSTPVTSSPWTSPAVTPVLPNVAQVLQAMDVMSDHDLTMIARKLMSGRRYFQYVDGRQQPMLQIDTGSITLDKFYLKLKTKK